MSLWEACLLVWTLAAWVVWTAALYGATVISSIDAANEYRWDHRHKWHRIAWDAGVFVFCTPLILWWSQFLWSWSIELARDIF